VRLGASDEKLAASLIEFFHDAAVEVEGGKVVYRRTTGEVLSKFSGGLRPSQSEVFRQILKKMCRLTRGGGPNEPGVWTLRHEFHPEKFE